MISIFPRSSETLVLVLTKAEVVKRILAATAHKTTPPNRINPYTRFSGTVLNDRFRISLYEEKRNNFYPIITGTIDATSAGCIIFLKYRLYPATRLLLAFWLVFIVALGVFFCVYMKNLWALALTAGLILSILFAAWNSFTIELKRIRHALHDVLE